MPIRRRTFLKSAAIGCPTFAASFLAPPSWGDESAPALHPVSAGQDRTGHPHSLGFSTLCFKVLTADTGGNLFAIEHTNLMPGTGPALHLHYSQDEWFYVMEGRVAFQVDQKRLQLGKGESVLGPRRVPHAFSAVDGPAHMLIAFTPADKMEQYFIDAVAHPKLAATEDFINRYDMKWLGPSPFWKTENGK
jgi:mannose-6-phosphate isomerase-like protein (cupin superfamily)